MRKFLTSLVGSSLITAALLVGPMAGPALAACTTCAETFDGTSYSGTEVDFDQGTSNADFRNIGWNDKISSMKVMDDVGHGFIWSTDIDFGGSQFKTCGTTSLPTLTLNNQLSSVQATTNCPG